MSDTAVKVNAPKSAEAVPGAMAPKRCACGGPAGPTGECEECAKKREVLQRASSGGPAPASIPPSVSRTLSSPGRALDPGPRSFMESRFGQDFGGVRVHTDSQAADSARDVNARAYTVGQHVAFDRGQYQPDTPQGQHLLAHELAHTVQQRGLQRMPNNQAILDPGLESRYERDANAAAHAVVTGQPAALANRSPAGLVQRVRWGPDLPVAPGQVVDARDPMVNQAAELKMREYYLSGHKAGSVVFSRDAGKDGTGGIEDFQTDNPKHRKLVKALKKEFFTRYGPEAFASRATISNPDTARATPEEGAPEEDVGQGPPVLGSVEGQKAARAEALPQFKQPDILDLDSGEVYDVTTIGSASDKVSKIDISYVTLLNDIVKKRGLIAPDFRAGTSLPAPPAATLLYASQPGRLIYFGSTDFSARPGVISYQAMTDKAVASASAALATETYVVKFGANELAFKVPPLSASSKEETIPLAKSAIPGNVAAAEGLQGMILRALTRKSSGNDIITAAIETKADPKTSTPSTQPIVVEGKPDIIRLVVDRESRQLSHQDKKVNIPFSFKGLSSGTITSLSLTPDGGLSGEGKIKPTIPLLSSMTLGVAFGPNDLRVTAGIEKEKLKIPIPGIRITKAELALILAPEFRPSGTIGVAFGPETKPYLDGTVEISADTEGFLAVATLRAHVPGVDEAEGKILYRPATGWNGLIAISTSQIPMVQNANVNVRISQESGLLIDGGATIVLLKDQLIAINIRKQGSRWIYTGRGVLTLPVPAVRPVDLTVNYDGNRVWGEGTAGFSVRGLDGTLNVKYNNGNFSGTAKVNIQKGKAKGSLNVNLNDRGRIFGDGQIDYQLTPSLVVVLGVELPEHGPLRVKSGVKLPKPIPLFDIKKDDFRLITISFPFWIPYVSIPGVGGLKVVIEGGLDIGYYLGAGVIRDVSIMAAFNPLEDDPDLAIQLGGELYIPFGGKLKGSISAMLELDGFVAGVSAGITAWAEAQLACEFKTRMDILYAKERFELAARASVLCGLTFELGLKFVVKAYLATYDDKWEWPIAGYKWDPGLSLGASFPFKYASDQPFTPPSFNQIEWVKPNLDPEKMLKSVIDGAKK